MCQDEPKTEADRKCETIIDLLDEVQNEFLRPIPSPDIICGNLEKAVQLLGK